MFLELQTWWRTVKKTNMRTRWCLLLFILLCGTLPAARPKAGFYRAVLIIDANAGLEIPFTFKLTYTGRKPLITIFNADERIAVDEITLKKDSLNFKMPVYDTEFRTRLVNGNLEGIWINHYKNDVTMRFKAVYGESRRFLFPPGAANPIFEGRWSALFSPGSTDSSRAIGVFHHTEQTNHLSGTFLSETGDYRYLEGAQQGDSLYLSAFDGSHAYLFIARLNKGTLEGRFYSGPSWSAAWTAQADARAELRPTDAEKILTHSAAQINFTFPGLDQQPVSLSDPRYSNKVVIVQIMGSWCPNCLDESQYFVELHKKFNSQGLEIVALAFERTSDEATARKRLLRLKERLGLPYPVLLTQLSKKEDFAAAVPGLKKITAFPTTLILDRTHKVVKVHEGFSGPATGADFVRYKEETEALLRQLLH